MGVDILGWVEVKRSDEWIGALRIDALVYRHKYGFGSMFLDDEMFQPIAKGRGLPDDVSEELKLSHPEEDWGHTWASWDEIAAIDWEAVYTPPSPRIYTRKRTAKGDVRLDSISYLHEMKDPPPLDFTHEGDTQIGDIVYSVVHEPSVQRKETLHAGWQVVFEVMRFITDDRGNENVRLVVWFNG